MLFLDCETSPHTVYTFDLWNAFIGQEKIIQPSRLLCWAASWYGEDKVMYASEYHDGRDIMLKELHDLLSEADVVVTYNGAKFDEKVINSEFLLEGFTPPKPFESLDLYKTIKKRFRLASNKLAYVIKELGLGSKEGHDHSLWVRCINGEAGAWKKMREYNKNDVVVLKSLYAEIQGWIPKHPNTALYIAGGGMCCPNCGGTDLTKRGFRTTRARKYQRFQCGGCGAWSSSRLSESGGDKILLA